MSDKNGPMGRPDLKPCPRQYTDNVRYGLMPSDNALFPNLKGSLSSRQFPNVKDLRIDCLHFFVNLAIDSYAKFKCKLISCYNKVLKLRKGGLCGKIGNFLQNL